jgi:hypothetical protein
MPFTDSSSASRDPDANRQIAAGGRSTQLERDSCGNKYSKRRDTYRQWRWDASQVARMPPSCRALGGLGAAWNCRVAIVQSGGAGGLSNRLEAAAGREESHWRDAGAPHPEHLREKFLCQLQPIAAR